MILETDVAFVRFGAPAVAGGSCRLLGAAAALLLATTASAQTPVPRFEGDVAHKADVARTAYGVTGVGVKGCVISYNILHNTLPNVDTPAGMAGPTFNGSLDGEGAAMLQIVHQLAPGASLGFATGFPTTTTMNGETAAQNAFQKLAAIGCNVIVDDLTNKDELSFQVDKASAAIDTITAQGVTVVTSAGNFGSDKKRTSSVWEGDFLDSGLRTNANDLVHKFNKDGSPIRGNAVMPSSTASDDPKQACPYNTLPNGNIQARAKAYLSWNAPSGNGANDYELYVYNISSNTPVAQGASLATEPNYPIKAADVYPDSALVIIKNATAPVRRLRLEVAGSCGRLKFATSGGIKGHNAAANAITVGAISVARRTTALDHTAKVDAESSDGNRLLYFQANGTSFPPPNGPVPGTRVLIKPDFAAASSVMTDARLPSSFNPFKGTSAAAPHVAAIAVLLKSYRPTLTPPQIREILRGSAIDIETPGVDELSGYGIPMADKALMLASSLQFGPKLALKRSGNVVSTFQLNADRSVTGWPQPLRANAVANAAVVTPEGGLVTLDNAGRMFPSRRAGSGVIGVSEETGLLFKSDGSTELYEPAAYNTLGLPTPKTDGLRNVVAAAGELASNWVYFLKRDGTVERWVFAQPFRKSDNSEPSPNFHKVATLGSRDVVDVRSMIGSLPLAMLRRDGTVVTVDKAGNPTDSMTYSSTTIKPRPANLRDVVAIATGYAHVVALRRDGTVVAWGTNSKHECDVPPAATNVVSIAAFGHRTYALTRSGQMVTWGSDN